MIKILHTADLHLDAPFPSLGEREEARQEDLLKTFDRIVNLAIKNDVDLLLVAGDLFDNPNPSLATVGRVQAGLQRLVDRQIVPVLLPGTHDHMASSDSVYNTADFTDTVVFTEPVSDKPFHLQVKEQDLFLYGFAYRSFASENALSGMVRRSEEGIHIGLLHGAKKGSPEWEYSKKDLPFSIDDLKAWNLDYVALGHYHGFEIIQDEGRTYASYPGSPEGKRFGENGPRYCSLVSVRQGGASVEKVKTNGRILEMGALDLSGYENERDVAEAINSLGASELLMRLSLVGIVEAPFDLAALQARCREHFFHLELRDKTQLFDSEFARRIEQESTVRGIFVRKVGRLLEETAEEDRPVIEEAFREVLVRFRAFDGGMS